MELVVWMNWKTDEPHDHVDFGGDAESEQEIKAIVGVLTPMEARDAVEFFAMWK